MIRDRLITALTSTAFLIPLGLLLATGVGWFIRRWWERRQATRDKQRELLIELLGTLRAHFTWLSGPAPTQPANRMVAGQRAQQIAEWIYANHPRFPTALRQQLFQIMNFAYWYEEPAGSPGRTHAVSTLGQQIVTEAWAAVQEYKDSLD